MFYTDYNDIFSSQIGEWNFSNDASGGDLYIMKYNNDQYKKLSDLPGWDQLSSLLKTKLQGASVYSKTEVDGWTRIVFDSQKTIDMFGAEEIFVPPSDQDALFFKELDMWFSSVPYSAQDTLELGEQIELESHKSYSLTDQLLDLFGS